MFGYVMRTYLFWVNSTGSVSAKAYIFEIYLMFIEYTAVQLSTDRLRIRLKLLERVNHYVSFTILLRLSLWKCWYFKGVQLKMERLEYIAIVNETQFHGV